MAGTLDYVQKGEAITAEKWNALVERINALEHRPNFGFGVHKRPKGGGGEPLALVAIRGYYTNNPWGHWVQDSNGVWHMPTAKFVDEITLTRGTENVDVYMTRALDNTFKNLGNAWYNRWAVYRNNRWELLDFQWTDSDTQYGPGLGIEIDADRKIINRGFAALYSSNQGTISTLNRSNGFTLYLGPLFSTSSKVTVVDVVGGTQLNLRTHRETVVTPTGNKEITVLGDS